MRVWVMDRWGHSRTDLVEGKEYFVLVLCPTCSMINWFIGGYMTKQAMEAQLHLQVAIEQAMALMCYGKNKSLARKILLAALAKC